MIITIAVAGVMFFMPDILMWFHEEEPSRLDLLWPSRRA